MTTSSPHYRPQDRVCACSGTTVAQIKRLFDRGVDTLDDISQATGALSGCGACDVDIRELLAEFAAEKRGASPPR